MTSNIFSLFGKDAEFYADAPEVLSIPIMEEAYEYALALQKIFNVYNKTSELSLLNKKRKIKASKELIYVIEFALDICKMSNGAYDITKGKEFLDRKAKKEIKPVKCSYKDLKIVGNEITLLNDEVYIDLGSLAKGFIAQKIANFLIEHGIESGFVDARGDISVFGEKRKIGVQHPRKDEILLNILIEDANVATSGDYKQFHTDYSKSHIINQKDAISVTVVSGDLMEADAYATLLMVSSPEEIENIVKEIKVPVLIINKNLKQDYYNGFEKLICNEN